MRLYLFFLWGLFVLLIFVYLTYFTTVIDIIFIIFYRLQTIYLLLFPPFTHNMILQTLRSPSMLPLTLPYKLPI